MHVTCLHAYMRTRLQALAYMFACFERSFSLGELLGSADVSMCACLHVYTFTCVHAYISRDYLNSHPTGETQAYYDAQLLIAGFIGSKRRC